MKITRLFLTRSAAYTLFVALWFPALAQTISPEGGEPQTMPGRRVELKFDPSAGSGFQLPPPQVFEDLRKGARTQSATFAINYLAAGSTLFGETCIAWPDNAKSAFAYAGSIWGSLLNSSVTITVEACWTNTLPVNTLGAAGATVFSRDFPGAPRAGVFYPIALANALSGQDLNGGTSEIQAVFNSAFPWYFGSDGRPSASQTDFATVVLHELGHGLGFLGGMDVQSGQGSWGNGSGFPLVYDLFTQSSTGQSLIDTRVFPNPSASLATQLQSNNIFLSATNANAANGGVRVPLYAPTSWQSGSSYSHFAESYNNTANALMTYSLLAGEALHDPGPVALGVMKDLGWTVSVVPPPSGGSRLINLSTRGPVQTGNDVMIGGFVISGSSPKKVLITARGPSLANFGISSPLADPKIELFAGQTKLMDNDNWQSQTAQAGGANAASAINALGVFPNGLAPSDPKEAALLTTLSPGAYTAVVSGANNGTGVGIVEVFEQDGPAIPLINISTRGRVQTGNDVMIGGFVISGNTPQTVLITARGPSLAAFGITSPLSDPRLEIFSGQTKIFENDDWRVQAAVSGGQLPASASSISALGVFPNGLAPSDDRESALLITLNPGAYTAVVSGFNGAMGTAIVEVFAR